MKAAIRRKYCSPEQLKVEEVEVPIPQENELLIKVRNTTVNRTDCANLSAKPFIMRFFLGLFKPKKVIVGTDFAGEVVSLGKDVKAFSIGDKVFGFDDGVAGSQSEFLVRPESKIFRIPNSIDFKTAAASLEGAHYAYSFIKKTNIQNGQRVFINGASGAIGSALIQFVKQFDVEISATCSTKNIELIKSLGAHKVFDYTKENFTNTPAQYDYVFDTVGKSTFGKCKPLLSKNGVYISSELGPYAQNLFYPLMNSFSSKKVIFPIPFSVAETIPYISTLLVNGIFKPIIDREYKLDEISKAYKYVVSGKKTGNVLINIF